MVRVLGREAPAGKWETPCADGPRIAAALALYILMYVVLAFSSLLQLRSVPPHCLRGLRFVYSQLESLTCSKCISTLEVSVSVQLMGSYAGDQIGKYRGNLKHHIYPSHIQLFLLYPILVSYPMNNDEVFPG